MARRVTTVKRVRRMTLPFRRRCRLSSRPVTICSLSSERSTALCSMPSCICICMRLSSSRMSSVMRRSRRAMNLAKTTTSGVSSSKAQASRASIERISRKAPSSCRAVMSICGRMLVVASPTTSMSLASRDTTSPECRLCSSNSCLENSPLNICSRRRLVCRVLARVVR